MHVPKLTHLLLPLVSYMLVSLANAFSQSRGDDFESSFSAGREYFILRSGNAKLILQCERSGTQPAFTYLLFDGDKPCQTLKKERAFNYSPTEGWTTSALEVVMRGRPFTALGHTTEARWKIEDGIPVVEARWWAGGIEVRESFMALEGSNSFLRTITLNGKDLAGPDSVRVRLSLPPGKYFAQSAMLMGITRTVALGIAFLDEFPAVAKQTEGCIETPYFAISPGGAVTVRSLLVARIPARGYSYDPECEYDRPIDKSVLYTDNVSASSQGLTAHYYSNPELRGAPIVVRTDTNLSPYWDTAPPAKNIPPDSFSVRWTGFIQAPRAGHYRFSLVADDRARLYIGSTLVIDCWENSWNVTKTADVKWESGKRYDIRVEFAELSGWAGMRLRWSIPAPIVDPKEVEAGVQETFARLERSIRSHAGEELSKTKLRWTFISSIGTKDSLVKRLYDNACFALPGMVGEKGRMDAGMFEYGTQWVRDGSNVALGLIHAGHFESARALLKFILTDLVAADGATVISGGFDEPGREEFDQMGELMHALKAYYDWTGDSLLITTFRQKIVAMIERPLHPRFRDSTGMVHNRREYWERTFDDAYELAYQTFMIRGLTDAADLARVLGVPAKAGYWREQAEVFLHAMLKHPSRSLVDQGALIKRRNVDGTIADFTPGPQVVLEKDDPMSSEAFHRLNPDASYALPIFLGVVEPRSDLARKTLDKLEAIWNARWTFGGYERYHSSSQQDQPGPWCFATASIARAQHDAGLHDKSRRSLEWLLTIQGGNAGTWFEEIPLIRSQMPTSGIVPWTSAEVVVFTIRHWLGLYFEGSNLLIRPNLFAGGRTCKADVRFRSSRIKLEIDKAGEVSHALVNGTKTFPRKDGSILIPVVMQTGNLDIQIFSR